MLHLFIRGTADAIEATDGRFVDSVLEFQIRSQVQMLYAVFQAHSTAEDEVIWPALRAKTASSSSSSSSSSSPSNSYAYFSSYS